MNRQFESLEELATVIARGEFLPVLAGPVLAVGPFELVVEVLADDTRLAQQTCDNNPVFIGTERASIRLRSVSDLKRGAVGPKAGILPDGDPPPLAGRLVADAAERARAAGWRVVVFPVDQALLTASLDLRRLNLVVDDGGVVVRSFVG